LNIYTVRVGGRQISYFFPGIDNPLIKLQM
jgi:hypothetical protein